MLLQHSSFGEREATVVAKNLVWVYKKEKVKLQQKRTASNIHPTDLFENTKLWKENLTT